MAHKRKDPDTESRSGGLDQASVLRAFREARQPLKTMQIMRRVGAPKDSKRTLKAVLRALLESGKLIRTKGGAYGLTESMSMVKGRLQVQRSGVGFVIPEDQRRKDIFVSRNNFGDAWHGDEVMVAVTPPRGGRDGSGRGKSAEGRIVRVLSRGLKTLAVRIERRLGPDLYLSFPTDPRLHFNVMTDTKTLPEDPERGDIVYVLPGDKLDSKLWAATAADNLGPEQDVEVQEKLVKIAHGIPSKFPRRVLDETNVLPGNPTEADFAGREDLRELGLVTIDGAKARDFDDAVHVRREGKGWRLTVAIADVSHYVAPGSNMDREAFDRGNSYYFPKSVEPMFPEALSNGLCSLNPDVPRLAMVAEIGFTANGHPHGERFYPAVIKSHFRLTYMQVHRALELRDEKERDTVAPVLPMLEEAERLARVLNGVRNTRGSLDFDLPEPEIMFNMQGETTDIRPRARTFAHQLIEEFMIAANEAVARFLTARDLPCLYRIHPEPDGDKLRSVFKLLSRTDLASKLPDPKDTITPADLQTMLTAAQGTDLEFLTGRLVLRSMMQAVYSPQLLGHFGLASECYCHFTSPIRRYADLVVHRSIKAALRFSDEPLPRPATLKKIADHISGRERVAVEAEREILKRLTILFLHDKVGESYTGIVNGVSDFGFWVELNEVMAEGMVRLSTLTDDYYNYLSDRQEIIGERTGKRFVMGQKIRVQLVGVSLSRLEVELALLDEQEE